MNAMEPDVGYQSLQETAARLRAGEITALALTEAMLARIERLNPTLHCYNRVLGEQARRRAAELDAHRAAGKPLAPLHGVPVALKDLLFTRGLPTASGTAVMRDFVPDYNATVVEKLQAAGAVVLGKVQLTEGAYGSHHPSVTPPRNPWDESLWPGVSSSGSGVSVAAGLAFAALGSDTGGSIRFPSAANGVVGIKPTYGLVSRHGAFPLAESLDHIGPLARSVADAALVLQVIAGHDPLDPTSSGAPVPDYLTALEPQGAPRIAIDRAFSTNLVHEAVAATHDQALGLLRDAGAEVVEVAVPESHDLLARNWVVTCSVECALAHQGRYPEQRAAYGPDLARLIDLGRRTSGMAYAGVERLRERFREQLDRTLATVDALLCPVIPVPLPTAAAMEEGNVGDGPRREFIAFTAPFDFSGHPTVTLPVALEDGAPSAVQLVGRRFDEAGLLRVAALFERARGRFPEPLRAG